jgi:hypothetical protein
MLDYAPCDCVTVDNAAAPAAAAMQAFILHSKAKS